MECTALCEHLHQSKHNRAGRFGTHIACKILRINSMILEMTIRSRRGHRETRTTATIPSSLMVVFKSRQNSTVKICPGTPPPEKQSWTTMSNNGDVRSWPECSNCILLEPTHCRASSRNKRLESGTANPKYRCAASNTAESISTIVVERLC